MADIFGSNALEYHPKVPTTSWISLMHARDMYGEVSFFSIFIFETYCIGTAFSGDVAVVWVWRVGTCVGL